MTDAGVAPVLGALREQSEALFGHTGALLQPIAVFDRPFSTIVRLRIVTPESAPSYAYTKIYKVRPFASYEVPRDPAAVVAEEFAATERLHRALAGRPGLSAPRPIASLPEHHAIVTEEIQGTPLDRVLRAARRRRATVPTLEAIATRIGAWLRAYQHASAGTGVWSAEESRAYLDDRLRYITPLLGEEPRVQALTLFDRLAARVPAAERLVPIHADLCPANILVRPDGGVAVLDFATAQTGTRFHDVAHLFLHLELARLRRRIAVKPIEEALMGAFDRADAVRDPLFRLMFLQHVVCHVTQLVDRGAWRPRFAVRALARWRWRACLAMSPLIEPVC